MALAAIFVSPGSHALGVGELRLQSALNQTLKAEVPLVISSEKLEDIKVTLGSANAFAQAGIERSQLLSSLRFRPNRRADGSHVIEIGSREPIREPFLSFLMEVDWPDGRIVKEFTVLLDPPAPVLPGVAPSRYVDQASGYRRPPSASGDSSPRVASAQERGPRQGGEISEYGPVRRRDTLSSIAKAMQGYDGLTKDQVAIGIYRANPQAFVDGKVNALRRGIILSIPSRQTMAQRVPADATREWRELWATVRQSTVAEATAAGPEQPSETSVATETRPAKEGQTSRLRLLAPGQKEHVTKPGAKEDLALEAVESVRQENEEIRARLGALEQQIAALQKLLELKDQQIATLQAGSAQVPAQSPPPQVATASPQPALAVGTAATPAAAPVQPPAGAVPVSASSQAAASRPPQVPVAEIPQPEEPAEDGMWLWGTGIAVVTLAAALAWWITQRRQKHEPGLRLPASLDALRPRKREAPGPRQIPSESVRSVWAKAVDAGETVDPIAEADAFLSGEKYLQAEQLMRAAVAAHPMRDEYRLKLLEVLYQAEKYEAFDELAGELSDWREMRPDLWAQVCRMGLKSRLKAPTELEAPGGEAAPTSEVQVSPEMPAEKLAPAPGAKSSPPSQPQVPEGPTQEAGMPISYDAKTPASEPESKPIPEPQPAAEAELEAKLEPAPAPVPEPLKVEQSVLPELEIAPLDFDLTGLDLKAEAPRVTTEPDIVHDEANLVAYEPVPAGTKAPAPEGETLEDLLAELENLGSQLVNEKPAGSPKETCGTGSSLSAGLPSNLVVPDAGQPAVAPLEPHGGGHDDDLYAEITDMDPIETKLDLSKAYVDMGDADAARELLEEVLATGSDRQKAEARTLMSRLDRSQGT